MTRPLSFRLPNPRRLLAAATALLLLLLARPGLAFAQSDPCLHRIEIISVLDKSGQPVSGLAPSDFKASLDGKAVRVVSVAKATGPTEVTLLVDTSLTMIRSPAWPDYMEAAKYFVARAPAGTSIQIALFSDRIRVAFPVTDDRAALQSQIGEIPSRLRSGSTALWDSIASVSGSFDSGQPGGIIFALSDGDDTASSISAEAASADLIERGVRLFSLSILTPDSQQIRTMLDQAKRFGDIARQSGGQGVVPPADSLPKNASNDLPLKWKQALQAQNAQMFDFYQVEIELPARLSKEEGWKLKLTDNHKGAQLLWPRKLAACPVPAQPIQ